MKKKLAEITPVDLLKERYRAQNATNLTEWLNNSALDISMNSAASVLSQGKHGGLVVMLKLALELGCMPDEIKWVCQQCGDDYLWRYINYESVTPADVKTLEALHRLSPEQLKLVTGLILELGKVSK